MSSTTPDAQALGHLYRLNDWKENELVNPGNGSRITEVRAKFTLEGAITAETEAFFVMSYVGEYGEFQGYERIVGNYQGRSGSIVVEHRGTFDPKGVAVRVHSVKNTGTDCFLGTTLTYTTRFEGHSPYALSIVLKN